MIKAVIFDLDDTLYDCLHDNDQAVEDAVAVMAKQYLHMERDVVREAFFAGRDQVRTGSAAGVSAASLGSYGRSKIGS